MPDLTLEQAARNALASVDAVMAGEDLFGETHSDAFARLRKVLAKGDAPPKPSITPAMIQAGADYLRETTDEGPPMCDLLSKGVLEAAMGVVEPGITAPTFGFAFQDRNAIPQRDLWEHAAPASNAASDARDLSMILTRALATHDDGFGPDELSALYTVAGMVTDKVTEAADKADEVCRLVDPPED